LAQAIGVTKSTISLYEVGDNVPDIKTLAKLADFYGVTSDYLLGRSDCQDSNNDEFHNITGLTEESIERLKQIKALGFDSILSKMVFHPDFISALSQMNNLITLELKEGFHAIVPEADFKAMSDGEKGEALIIDRSVIEDIYSTRAKESMSKVVAEVLKKNKD